MHLKKWLAAFLSVLLLIPLLLTPAEAAWSGRNVRKTHTYSVSDELNEELQKVYKRYNFTLGWGVYDISGNSPKEIASDQADKSFQSNCTIKAAMLLLMCKKIDKGELSLEDTMYVNPGKMHYNDFGKKSGDYTVDYLLTRMIHESNNVCYEVFLKYVTKETFNDFLASLGSGTKIKSYTYMGNCTVRDRATEWYAIYSYCHSKAKNAKYAWNLFVNAKFSPIRDGLKDKTVAHKSGWYDDGGAKGTAGDCAVIKTEHGGCYLMVMFTKNNVSGKYSQKLMRELAVVLDKIWTEYYLDLPPIRRKRAKF